MKAANKLLKTEFMYRESFKSFEDLQVKLRD
jgi:hypothetical protein